MAHRPNPLACVAVHRPLDPGGDAFAILGCRVVRHRHRVAQHLEQVVRVGQGQSAKSQSVGGQDVHGSQDRAGRRVQSAAMTSHGAMTIYLDHAATTPHAARGARGDAAAPDRGLRQPVVGSWARPPGAHGARRGARGRSPRAIGAQPREIVFTAGGTEATNLAIKGAAWAGKGEGHRIVTSAVEHDATLNALQPSREVRLRGHRPAGRPLRSTRPRDARCRARRAHHPGLPACSPTTRSARSSRLRDLIARVRRIRGRRTLVHVDAVQAAPYVDLDVAGPRRRPGRHRGAQVRGAQGHGRAVRSAAARRSWRRRTAARRSAFAAPAPRTSPAPWAWPSRYELATQERNDDVPRLAAQRDRLRDALPDRCRGRAHRPPARAAAGPPVAASCGETDGDALVRRARP